MTSPGSPTSLTAAPSTIGPRPRAAWLEAPATVALSVLWVVVYAAMVAHQGTFVLGFGSDQLGGISTATTHLFGDQTPAAIRQGEWWRALTSTFIHFFLPHLVLNLLGFVVFGWIVEESYGSGPFLAIYAAIGLIGNLLSAAIKLWVGALATRPSGGGSGVAVGLIALIAVAGWRSGTRFGLYVRGLMVGLLVMLAVMGGVFPMHDNLGHATGGLVGAAIGLIHRPLKRLGRSGRGILGVLGLIVLIGCVAAQAADARREWLAYRARVRATRVTLAIVELARAHVGYRELTRRGPRGRREFDLLRLRPKIASNAQVGATALGSLRNVERLGVLPSRGPAAESFRRARAAIEAAGPRPPTPGQFHAFDRDVNRVADYLRRELIALQKQAVRR